jgi:hypothetical protein
VRKLDKISFRYYTTRFAVVKQLKREIDDLYERCQGEVRRLQVIEFVAFDANYCLRLAELLSGRNDVVVVVSGDSIQVVIGGITESSKLHRLP